MKNSIVWGAPKRNRKDGERGRARHAGLKTYFTGRPCHRGHLSERNTCDGKCRQCRPPSAVNYAAKSAKWRKDNPQKETETRYRYRYGVELSQIRPKPENCELCGMAHKKIVFDHDHISMKFRGWICDPCNIVLGSVKENIETLKKMTQYLEKYQQDTGSGQCHSKKDNQEIPVAEGKRGHSVMLFG